MWIWWAYLQVFYLAPLIQYIQMGVLIVTTLLYPVDYYQEHAKVYDGQSFDFIIVGAGSAGCVVANRLSEVKDWSVLLIEAGDDPPYAAEIPGLSVLLGATFPDWTYHTVNDNYSSQKQKNQRIHAIQGKMLGGSSNVNYMYYVRGYEENYKDWVNRGNKGWDWDSVARYYEKSELSNSSYQLNSRSVTFPNSNQYLGLTQPPWNEQIEKYLNSFKEKGHTVTKDYKDSNHMGYTVPLFNFFDNRRQSGSHSYIKPVVARKNLFILKKTMGRRIMLADKTAIGVEIEDSNGNTKKVYARKEIIISAGAISSPKLLMLSGIGPKEHLSNVGIETIVKQSNVGTNLQDHLLVPIIISGGNTASFSDNMEALKNMDKFPVPAIMGLIPLNKDQKQPDYQVTAFPLPYGSVFPTLMCSNVFKWDNDICLAMANSTNQDTFFALISFLRPKSRGTIKLKTKNPDDDPLLSTGYFSNKNDIKYFAKCVKDFTSAIDSTYFKSVNAKIVDFNVKECDGIEFGSQEYWECYVLHMAASQFHFSGTCAMGPDGEGVVDERLRVRNVKGLRVVDASIMPSIVSGNTHATVVMIAEKASDMIKTDNIDYVGRTCRDNDLESSFGFWKHNILCNATK